MKAIEAPKRAIIASFYAQSFTLIATFLFITPGIQNHNHLNTKAIEYYYLFAGPWKPAAKLFFIPHIKSFIGLPFCCLLPS